MEGKGKSNLMMLLGQYWNEGQPHRSYYAYMIVLDLLLIFVLNLSDVYFETVVRATVSNGLLLLYLVITVKLAKGRCRYKYILNTSLYMHVFFLLSNWAEDVGIWSLVILPITHFCVIIIQINMMKKLACKENKIQLIIGIEIFYIIYCFTCYVFAYVQDYMLFAPRIMNFPLIA